jgi:hypothetical protein
MSFYSYKNANAEVSPGTVNGNILTGLNQRVCIQVKNVYDSCLNQTQLDDKRIVVSNIVPVIPGDCRSANANSGCNCSCEDNVCSCRCNVCGQPITHEQAVENAENSPCPLPTPCGTWTFESCRSSTTKGRITNLSVERLCDRPQFARIRATVDVPIDVLFTDQRCQEWLGQAIIQVDRDVLLCIPEDSIVPFTVESLVSAICVSGSYIGNCTFEITVCITIVLKVLAEVDIMVPTYGFCEVPPCEEFAEAVCDEFFSLPLFPRSSCAFETVAGVSNGNGTTNMFNGQTVTCPGTRPVRGCGTCVGSVSTCSNCGTTCQATGSSCPRCGSVMSSLN